MLHDPFILSRLLAALQWSSFHSLLSACRDFRQVFSRLALRDVILSGFVPGYKLALGNRQIADLSVDITIEDLALFRTFLSVLRPSLVFDSAYTDRNVAVPSSAHLSHACSGCRGLSSLRA